MTCRSITALEAVVAAHVDATGLTEDEVRQRHTHAVQFQMVYVLKGWIKTQFEGQGAHTMKAGSAWLQPPNIKHKVLDYSDDCEVLEIVLPADFEDRFSPAERAAIMAHEEAHLKAGHAGANALAAPSSRL